MDSEMNKDYLWESIDGFESHDEFIRFYDWLEKQVVEGLANEILVKTYYAGPNFKEQWFENKDGEVWRLVAPDFPFEGYWGPI